MNSIGELVKLLDRLLTDKWQEYCDLHEQFKSFDGKKLTVEEHAEFSAVFDSIEDAFAEVYPIFNFIAGRVQFVDNAATGYNEFILRLKKLGYLEEVNNKKLIIK